MPKNEFELELLRAMHEWMNEEHNTRMMVMQRDISRYSDQLEKEEAALKKYRDAQRAFIDSPKK